MESVGKVIQILPLQEGVSARTGNPWATQSFIIETLGQYPRKQAFEIFGKERIQQNLPAMDAEVKVSFDLESREYNGRWYTSARAFKVELNQAAVAAQPLAAAQPQAAQPVQQQQQAAPATPAAAAPVQESTELPF